MKTPGALFLFLTILAGCHQSTGVGDECNLAVGDVVFSHSFNRAIQLVESKSERKVTLNGPEKTDYFNSADGKEVYGNAPLLVFKNDFTKPFTFIAKVTPNFEHTYDAGTLFIYVNQKDWVKFAFEKDDTGKTRIVTVRTQDTSDDNNHSLIDSSSVYLKISSDATTLGFYFSEDGIEWQLARLFKNDFSHDTFLGISSQSPIGNGTVTLFEEIRYEQQAVKDFRLGK